MKIRIKEDIKLDYFEVQDIITKLFEQEIKGKEKKPLFPMDYILFKFPTVKKVLTELLTTTFRNYIKNIYVVAPKPTTLKVILKNDQEFLIIYNDRSYIVKVSGKKYYLLNIDERQRATEAIADLLNTKNFITSKSIEEEDNTPNDEKPKKLGRPPGSGKSSTEEPPSSLTDIGKELQGSEEEPDLSSIEEPTETPSEEEPITENKKLNIKIVKDNIFDLFESFSNNLELEQFQYQLKEDKDVKEITSEEAADLILNSKGSIFTVEFTKKDGTHRVLNGRKGVKKYLRGGSLAYNPEDKGLIGVYDIQLPPGKGYRMLHKDSIVALRINGKNYRVVQKKTELDEIQIKTSLTREQIADKLGDFWNNSKISRIKIAQFLRQEVNFQGNINKEIFNFIIYKASPQQINQINNFLHKNHPISEIQIKQPFALVKGGIYRFNDWGDDEWRNNYKYLGLNHAKTMHVFLDLEAIPGTSEESRKTYIPVDDLLIYVKNKAIEKQDSEWPNAVGDREVNENINEISIKPTINYHKEYQKIYDRICDEYDISSKDIEYETTRFINYEGDINYDTNKEFKDKFGFDYWEWEEKHPLKENNQELSKNLAKKKHFINQAIQDKIKKLETDPEFISKQQQAQNPSGKQLIQNIEYYQQLLQQSRLSPKTRTFIQGIINNIKQNRGLASSNQLSILSKFKSGNLQEITINPPTPNVEKVLDLILELLNSDKREIRVITNNYMIIVMGKDNKIYDNYNEFLKELPKHRLIKVYNDLLKIKKAEKHYNVNEIQIKQKITPSKSNFQIFTKKYNNILKSLKPQIIQAYNTQNFQGLGDIIIKAFLPIKNYFDAFSNEGFSFFKEWIKNIDNENLPIDSSGSFWTALNDNEWQQYNDFDDLDEIQIKPKGKLEIGQKYKLPNYQFGIYKGRENNTSNKYHTFEDTRFPGTDSNYYYSDEEIDWYMSKGIIKKKLDEIQIKPKINPEIVLSIYLKLRADILKDNIINNENCPKTAHDWYRSPEGNFKNFLQKASPEDLRIYYKELKELLNFLNFEKENNLTESRLSDLKSKLVGKSIDENEFNQISNIQIPKPIYTEWLINSYIKEFKSQNKSIDDFLKLEPGKLIEFFEKNKNLFDNKDITSYTINSLNQKIMDITSQVGPASALSTLDLDKLSKVGFKNLGEIEGYQIIKIPKGKNSPGAWQTYKNIICQGRTRVCTASNYTRFEYYTTNDNLFLLVNPNDEKAPYHYSKFTDSRVDKDDQKIEDPKILKIIEKLK